MADEKTGSFFCGILQDKIFFKKILERVDNESASLLEQTCSVVHQAMEEMNERYQRTTRIFNITFINEAGRKAQEILKTEVESPTMNPNLLALTINLAKEQDFALIENFLRVSVHHMHFKKVCIVGNRPETDKHLPDFYQKYFEFMEKKFDVKSNELNFNLLENANLTPLLRIFKPTILSPANLLNEDILFDTPGYASFPYLKLTSFSNFSRALSMFTGVEINFKPTEKHDDTSILKKFEEIRNSSKTNSNLRRVIIRGKIVMRYFSEIEEALHLKSLFRLKENDKLLNFSVTTYLSLPPVNERFPISFVIMTWRVRSFELYYVNANKLDDLSQLYDPLDPIFKQSPWTDRYNEFIRRIIA